MNGVMLVQGGSNWDTRAGIWHVRRQVRPQDLGYVLRRQFTTTSEDTSRPIKKHNPLIESVFFLLEGESKLFILLL